MTDHETFLLLAAKQVGEPLSAEATAELDRHLAGCPSCRSIVTEMRRDDLRLRAMLRPAPVAPSVRRRVLEEASGRRRFDRRLVLGLAAAVLLSAIGVPLIAGGRLASDAGPSLATPVATVVPPSPSGSLGQATGVVQPTVVATTTPTAPTSPASSSVGSAGFVSGAYTYGETPSRRDTVAAHFDGGAAVGEWSRRIPATGASDSYGGPLTCLVISGTDAWLAGPATTATDGTKGRAALIYVHDGGADGAGDTAVLWLSTPGQTVTTMVGWCETKFIPAGPFPLTSGDVVVRPGPS